MELSAKDQAVASSDILRKLAEEHSQYSRRLDALTEKRYLSEEEKLEEVRLKKLKLRLKDEIAAVERRVTHSHVA